MRSPHRWRAVTLWTFALALAVLPLWPGAPDIGISIAMLAVIQVALSGFHLAAWALLPMSVDQGEARTGVRVEATAFSLFMLVQKIGLGLAALFLGLAYAMGGYAGGEPDAAGRDVITWVMIAVVSSSALLLWKKSPFPTSAAFCRSALGASLVVNPTV